MSSMEMHETNTVLTVPHAQIAHAEDDGNLEMLELEFAIDREVLTQSGFEQCLLQACETSGFEYLFQLPALDEVPGQRIAVIAAGEERNLLFAVLNDDGTEIELVPEAAMREDIRSFAAAFTEVFTQLGSLVPAE